MSQPCNKRRLHVGMRNFKTSLAVLVILVLYHFMGRGGFLASTTAIICMRDTIDQSVTFGMDRMLGTFIGAILGVGLYSLHLYLPFQRNYTHLMAALGVMLLIALCNYTNKNDAIIMACVVFLAIILQENEDSPLIYSINRLVDTLIGIVAALLINRFIKNPDRRYCDEEDSDECEVLCEVVAVPGIAVQGEERDRPMPHESGTPTAAAEDDISKEASSDYAPADIQPENLRAVSNSNSEEAGAHSPATVDDKRKQ